MHVQVPQSTVTRDTPVATKYLSSIGMVSQQVRSYHLHWSRSESEHLALSKTGRSSQGQQGIRPGQCHHPIHGEKPPLWRAIDMTRVDQSRWTSSLQCSMTELGQGKDANAPSAWKRRTYHPELLSNKS